jgi:transcriptional regulator with XRE-family HTH domain
VLAVMLRAVREQRGWSQRALAARSGVSHASIARVESGITKELGSEALARLATALHVSADRLLGLAADTPSIDGRDADAAALVATFHMLREHDRQVLLRFVRFLASDGSSESARQQEALEATARRRVGEREHVRASRTARRAQRVTVQVTENER